MGCQGKEPEEVERGVESEDGEVATTAVVPEPLVVAAVVAATPVVAAPVVDISVKRKEKAKKAMVPHV